MDLTFKFTMIPEEYCDSNNTYTIGMSKYERRPLGRIFSLSKPDQNEVCNLTLIYKNKKENFTPILLLNIIGNVDCENRNGFITISKRRIKGVFKTAKLDDRQFMNCLSYFDEDRAIFDILKKKTSH